LKALDRRGTFGKGAARAKVTLVIVTEDTEDDFSRPSAKALNPPAVFKRFERQTRVEGTFKSNDAIAVSPDGKRLYAAGSRDLSDEEDDDVNEIVALDLRGRRLERRWVFSFPTFGDSVNEMAVTGDGRSLFVLRGRMKDGDDDDALVMRFGRDRNKRLAEYSVPKGGTFAVTADGSRCAVATSGKELVLLDGANLRPLGRRRIGLDALSMHFRSGRELLVGTEKGIFRIDPEADGPPRKVADVSAHRVSVDDAGKLLAVSQWFDLDDRRENPFGVRLFRLPSLKLVRTFAVPGHRCVTVGLAPDGKRIAFEAHDTASRRKHVVAFDVATGKEIARRRSDFIQDLAFLRDNRTLAIGASGTTKRREAVELWVPGV
jgi:sugar lactone lactonase YvrE